MHAFISLSTNAQLSSVTYQIQLQLSQMGYNPKIFSYNGEYNSDLVTQDLFVRNVQFADVFFGIIVDTTNTSDRILNDFDHAVRLQSCKVAVLLVDKRIGKYDIAPKHTLYFDPTTGEIENYAILQKILKSIKTQNTASRLFFGAAALTLLGIVVSGSLSSTGSEPTRTSNASTGVAVSKKPSAKKPVAKKPVAKKPVAKKPVAKKLANRTAAKKSPKR